MIEKKLRTYLNERHEMNPLLDKRWMYISSLLDRAVEDLKEKRTDVNDEFEMKVLDICEGLFEDVIDNKKYNATLDDIKTLKSFLVVKIMTIREETKTRLNNVGAFINDIR